MSQETMRHLILYSYRKMRKYMQLQAKTLPYICMFVYTDMDFRIGLNTCIVIVTTFDITETLYSKTLQM